LRIWFDVLTPKQVMFFKNAVELLRQRNYEVLCTARDYRECVKLADLKKFELKLVGNYGGVSKYDKLRASSSRTFELAKVIEGFNPDLCISFSSPEAARVAFGLGIPHITFSDSPHAQAVQKLTIPFVNYLLCPWIIPFSAWTNFGILRKQIFRYRALDPVAWIRNETKNLNTDNLKKKYHLSKSSTFVIRPEESKASYLIDTAHNNVNQILQSIVHNYHDSTNILVLCRYQDQIRQFKEKYGDKILVLENVVDGLELISIADIFIGGGGTMTAESALLGKPTISISPIKFYVDDYLVKTGLIYKIRNAAQILKILHRIQSDDSFKLRQKNRAQHILNRMEDPANKLLKIVSKFVSL
jgi:predicted glycosyltransferase